jgi:sugar phosphate isomerase/epimerase
MTNKDVASGFSWTFRCSRTLAIVALVATSVSAQPRVQVGYCTSVRNIAAAKAAGFDYIEVGTSEIAAMPDADFDQALQKAKQVGLPVPAANTFLPATLKVTGPAIDPEQQLAYVRKALDRLSKLGVQTVVFGSGGARRVPDGFSKDEAFGQLVAFGKRVAPEARSRGMTIAVEPLRREETNIINSAAEGLALVEAIGDPNFQLMIDFYHLSSEHEDPAVVSRAKDRLRHLHMANPTGRVFPLAWEEFDYGPFFAQLRQTGYTRRISVEASTKDLTGDAPRAIGLLRRAFEAPSSSSAARASSAEGARALQASGQTSANLGYDDTPMQPDGKWRVHDGRRPQPRVVNPGPAPASPLPVPADATVLIGARDDLSAWRMANGSPATWSMKNGIVETGKGMIYTRAEFTDFQLHVEFATPSNVIGDSQGRGNSGVYLLGKFEIQVLDSYNNPTYPDGQAAAMYGQHPPLVNASRPPGEWQTYDIVFTAPRFSSSGTLEKPAVVTVLHNGIIVQNAMSFWGPTAHKKIDPYTPDSAKGPIALQDHGNPVRYRNVWIRKLDDPGR